MAELTNADIDGIEYALRNEERNHRSGLPGPRRQVAYLMLNAAEAISQMKLELEHRSAALKENPNG